MDLLEVNRLNKNRHPWELSRRNSILSLLDLDNHDLKYADIGSGDMFFVESLKPYTSNSIYAVDINYDIEKNHADKKLTISRDIQSINEHEIDCIFLMDILEHIGNEKTLLEPLKAKMNNNCKIIISVPAHQFLFSKHDVFVKHFRRYSRSSLVLMLESNGYNVNECFYFYASLFIVRVFEKILSILFGNEKETTPQISNWPYASKNIVTKILTYILNLDFIACRYLNRVGIRVPGLSLCAICHVKSVS